MEEIQQRLKDAADQSMKALAAWATNKQNAGARESLLEAVHELRKVSARLEIEIATSEREDSSGRSLPIPSHRSHQRRGPQENMGDQSSAPSNDQAESDIGNEGQQAARSSAPRGQFRRPARRPSQGE